MHSKSKMCGRDIIQTYVRKERYDSRRHGHMSGVYDMSTRPEFYSGRGATTSDLGSHHLEMIYDGVKTEYGDEAASRFAQFVYDLEVLSATAFLNAFYAFCDQDCKWTPRKHSKQDDIDFPNDDEGRFVVGVAVLGMAFGRPQPNQTESIRYAFLRKHEREIDFWRGKEKNPYLRNDGSYDPYNPYR